MNIQQLIDDYALWLKKEITFEKIGEFYEITTPYLDSANDYLQIYVKQVKDEIYFTDDCATIQNLKMAGFQFTKAREQQLEYILKQFGITKQGDELTLKAPAKSFPQKKHLFIQAILRIDDMFTITKSKVSSFFLDDVHAFFDEKEIFYSENVQFTGYSGFSHNYNFLLQRSKTKPERLCQTINSPNKTNMGNLLFAWSDTKPSRREDSQLIVILNDDNKITKGIEDAFINYDAKVIKWSERENKSNLDSLTA